MGAQRKGRLGGQLGSSDSRDVSEAGKGPTLSKRDWLPEEKHAVTGWDFPVMVHSQGMQGAAEVPSGGTDHCSEQQIECCIAHFTDRQAEA